MVFGITEHHIQALVFAGYQSEAEALAEQWAHQTIDIPVTSTAYTALFLGHVQLGADVCTLRGNRLRKPCDPSPGSEM